MLPRPKVMARDRRPRLDPGIRLTNRSPLPRRGSMPTDRNPGAGGPTGKARLRPIGGLKPRHSRMWRLPGRPPNRIPDRGFEPGLAARTSKNPAGIAADGVLRFAGLDQKLTRNRLITPLTSPFRLLSTRRWPQKYSTPT